VPEIKQVYGLAKHIPFATDNYKELLIRDDIDIIEICTPNYLHIEIIIEALNAGKHVNYEKPLAMNLSEAKEIIDTANSYPELIHRSHLNIDIILQ